MKKRAGIWAFARNAVLTVALLLGLLVWRIGRDVPEFLRIRLERALSGGIVAVRFDKASAKLSGEITVENVRINLKRSLDPPIATARRLRLRLCRRKGVPFYAWVNSVEADGLVVRPIFDIEFADGDGDDAIVRYFDYATRENDWFSNPIPVSIRDSDIFTVKFREASFMASAKDNVIRLDNGIVSLRSSGFDESVSGWATFTIDPFEARVRAEGTLTHEVVTGLIDALGGQRANSILAPISSYSTPMRVSGELLWREPPDVPSTQDLRLAVAASGLRYNGEWLDRLKVVLQWVSAPSGDSVVKRLVVSPVDFTFRDGSGTLAAVWRPQTHDADLRVDARAPIERVVRLLTGEALPTATTNVVFTTPPEMSVSANFSFIDEPTRAVGSFAAQNATVWSVPLEDVRLDVSYEEGSYLSVTNASARLFEGTASASATLDGDLSHYNADISLADLDCAQFRKHFIGKDIGGQGTVAINLSLGGETGARALDTLSGSGRFSVHDGNILRLPLFAGLTDFIGRNVPGVDLLIMQSDASSRFSITNGLVEIKRLSVSGNLFSLVATGKCRLNTEGTPVDMLAQLRFFHSQSLIGRLARLVTLPVSKMMEFKVKGPAEDASWNYVGIIDRIVSIFREDEDVTALPAEEPEARPDGNDVKRRKSADRQYGPTE